MATVLASDDTEVLRVKCRARSGMTAELAVLDISAGGCMVEYRGWSARAGERVLATLPGLTSLPAELVWIEDNRAGIAFEQPLHEAVLQRYESMLVR